ncbi:FAD-dependent oxidoreductase, partial [Actinospica durhamensis]
VVGAGFLGAEAASVVRSAGVEVTVLEPAAVPLAHAVGRRVGEAVAKAHRDHGVDLRTGVAVASVAEGGVLLANGECVEADEVLVAVGSIPNTEWLRGSGLMLRDGLVCDACCRAAPGVFAVGDVARWHNPLYGVDMRLEHRTNASEQGVAVARNVLNPQAPKPFAPVPYFWSDQFDLRIQAHGYLRGHDAVALVEGDVGERRFVAAYRTGGCLAGVLAMGMAPRVLRPWRQLVAARATWAECVPIDAPVLD